ncbi:hypothetical protein EDD11_008058, partial [Mortierella claussenii]
GNTLLTKALDAYMRLVGTEYLDDTLGDILRGICKNKVACEVDPSKLDKNDDLKAQWKILKHHTRTCWFAVTESVNHFPRDLLLVFSHLQRRLTEKFSDRRPSGEMDPDSELASLARYTGVSGFVFLRLICPAILGPKLFYIVREHPEAKVHRTLTLIAKSLQGLANLVMFGTKEAWMVPMNDFIMENTKSLKDFIDQICLADASSGLKSSANSVRSFQMQPPPSPGSTSSSTFRAQMKNGNVNINTNTNTNTNTSTNTNKSNSHSASSQNNGTSIHNNNDYSYQGSGGVQANSLSGLTMMASLPSPLPQHQTQGSRTTSSQRAQQLKDTVLPPTGSIDQAMLDKNQDMPLLPHLIDLGKELAHFTTTVARVTQLYPHDDSADAGPYGHESQEDPLTKGRGNNGALNSHSFMTSQQPTYPQGNPKEYEPEDILRVVARACWDIIETIQERVELSVELEQEERLQAAVAAVAAVGGSLPGGMAGGGGGANVGPMMYAQFAKSKVSREGSRDGEESYVVYEHEGPDLDAESIDGYGRGVYDSDDESFGQQSAHELL